MSPLGIVPKKEPNAFRLIHHLSFPKGESINDAIPKELCTVQYQTIQDAIAAILECGPTCFLGKTDLESAFRQILVHPSQYPLLLFDCFLFLHLNTGWNPSHWKQVCWNEQPVQVLPA